MLLPPILRFWPVLTVFGPIHIDLDLINLRWADRTETKESLPHSAILGSSAAKVGVRSTKTRIGSSGKPMSTPTIWGWFLLPMCGKIVDWFWGLPHYTPLGQKPCSVGMDWMKIIHQKCTPDSDKGTTNGCHGCHTRSNMEMDGHGRKWSEHRLDWRWIQNIASYTGSFSLRMLAY